MTTFNEAVTVSDSRVAPTSSWNEWLNAGPVEERQTRLYTAGISIGALAYEHRDSCDSPNLIAGRFARETRPALEDGALLELQIGVQEGIIRAADHLLGRRSL